MWYDFAMKNVLIVGKNSYIGSSLAAWLQRSPEEFTVETISQRDDGWKALDFGRFDAVVDCVGVAHVDDSAISEEESKKYFRINTDLATETARKAKTDGARQFIYMSSAIVYGKQQHITKETLPASVSSYGESKLQAEKALQTLEDETFRVALIRAPMIYGPHCKGNYPRLSKLAHTSPAFPMIENRRSMLYIDNLCNFLSFIIKNAESGVFWPQNETYTCTSEMVKTIAAVHGHRLLLVPGLKPLLNAAGKFSSLPNKVFGDMYYDMSLSEYRENYRVCSFEESIRRTEQH